MLTGKILRGRCSTCGAPAKARYDNGHERETGAGKGTRKRYRSYICPDPPDGKRCFRQGADAIERFVMLVVLRFLAPDGPYAQYLASVTRPVRDYAPELARLDRDEDKLRRKAKAAGRLLADETAEAEESGDEFDEEFSVASQTSREIRGKLRDLRDERARLKAAQKAGQDGQPGPVRVPTPEEWEAWDGPTRAEFAAPFITEVRIDPPGQGMRFFSPETVHVIPGAWADGISPAVLGACVDSVMDEHYPDQRLGRTRAAVTAWLADHPWATAREIAAGAGINASFAYSVLDAAEAAGEIVRHRAGQGRGGGAVSMRFALAGTEAGLPEAGPDPRLARTQAKITAFLAGHPWSAGDAVAEAAGLRSPSRARQIMNAMTAAGTVRSRIPEHDGRNGRMPTVYALAGQAAGDAAAS